MCFQMPRTLIWEPYVGITEGKVSKKSPGREIRLVTNHMIKETKIKNPRSKRGGLRNKGYKITKLSHKGN